MSTRIKALIGGVGVVVVVVVIIMLRSFGGNHGAASAASTNPPLDQNREVELLIMSAPYSDAVKLDALRSFRQTGVSQIAEEQLRRMVLLPAQVSQLEQNLTESQKAAEENLNKKILGVQRQTTLAIDELNTRFTKAENQSGADLSSPFAHLPMRGGGQTTVEANQIDREFRNRLAKIEAELSRRQDPAIRVDPTTGTQQNQPTTGTTTQTPIPIIHN
ncbi:MAG: hypothetical protein A3A24_01110 [Candidatus Buchananbacteria bacterium RIFCSPLOWO2_01_FULL_46_12]|uniref:Uncharacterized protein n=2 Tax=Candidatus Buchananiibacteriota TaxID=1817903 RepID=A0A1G1YRU2_9BACT|nr:MAG: hypothetical protein A2744_00310 [Candidatus Buchananbacteria bacterium RIFCSPHIGHO2_01_FULL_44_11]OGY55063.1 MAG: hypothetical protein A3A24_01110 [Candidatus Buchananbacteria bacterium RIFCSPLOWO2_01_FULL_46_12]